MTRRRELKGIAGHLLGSFVSRNNDVNGYWAIGKLCSHARSTPQGTISIDLLSKTLTPPGSEFEAMLDRYVQRFESALQKRSFPSQWLSAAEILIAFEASHSGGTVPFQCSVKLTDDSGRRHIAQHSGEVRPHDPQRESQSARVGVGSLRR